MLKGVEENIAFAKLIDDEKAAGTWSGLMEAHVGGHAPCTLPDEGLAAMAASQIHGVPHIDEAGRVSYVEHGLGWRRAGGDWPAGDVAARSTAAVTTSSSSAGTERMSSSSRPSRTRPTMP